MISSAIIGGAFAFVVCVLVVIFRHTLHNRRVKRNIKRGH